MKRIHSNVDVQSAAFKENVNLYQEDMKVFAERMEKVMLGGGEKARSKHESRGKLMARQRIERVLDPGSSFLELSPLAAHEVYDSDVPSAGVADFRLAPSESPRFDIVFHNPALVATPNTHLYQLPEVRVDAAAVARIVDVSAPVSQGQVLDATRPVPGAPVVVNLVIHRSAPRGGTGKP